MRIDHESHEPPYLQLARQLRDAITDGTLAPGERLPSGPTLASDLGISRATVQQALRQLKADGLVTSRSGSGVFVLAEPGDNIFADVDPDAIKVHLALYGMTVAQASIEGVGLIVHAVKKRDKNVAVRILCASDSVWSWRVGAEPPPEGARILETSLDAAKLDAANFALEVRAAPLLPQLRVMIQSAESQGRATKAWATFLSPTSRRIDGEVPWGTEDAGEAALNWFDRQWSQ